MRKGDYIKCSSADETIRVMQDLAQEDVETDFVYEKDGVKGFWLIVTKA